MANKKPLTKRRKAEQELKAKQEKQKRLKIIIIVSVVSFLAICGIVAGIIIANYEPPPKAYLAEIVIKDKGTVTVQLDDTNAPKTVGRFVKLANDGFYNGLPFYMLANDALYSGDPDGTGNGGYKTTLIGEMDGNRGHVNKLSHKKGVISLDRREDDPDSGTSRFFILTKDHTELDGKYASFGFVTSGLDIIEGLSQSVTTGEDGIIEGDSKPIIESITIKQIKLK